MSQLSAFRHMDIDWDMTPETAVTLYLEWGNNDWRADHPPVRSKNDYSTYFIVDNWGDRPRVYLIKRNSDEAQELATLELPDMLVEDFRNEHGALKGVFEPTPRIKEWLSSQLTN